MCLDSLGACLYGDVLLLFRFLIWSYDAIVHNGCMCCIHKIFYQEFFCGFEGFLYVGMPPSWWLQSNTCRYLFLWNRIWIYPDKPILLFASYQREMTFWLSLFWGNTWDISECTHIVKLPPMILASDCIVFHSQYSFFMGTDIEKYSDISSTVSTYCERNVLYDLLIYFSSRYVAAYCDDVREVCSWLESCVGHSILRKDDRNKLCWSTWSPLALLRLQIALRYAGFFGRLLGQRGFDNDLV